MPTHTYTQGDTNTHIHAHLHAYIYIDVCYVCLHIYMYINLGFRYIHIYRDGIATAAARTDAIAGPLAKPRSRGCYDCHGKSEGIYTAYKYMYILPWELEGICTAHKYMYMRRLQ